VASEASALTAEYNRIISSTSFNGESIFTEAGKTEVIQFGRDTVNSVSISTRALLGLGESGASGSVEITSFDFPDYSGGEASFLPGEESPYYVTLSTPTEVYNFIFLPTNTVAPTTLPPGQNISLGWTANDNGTGNADTFANAANATGVFSAQVSGATVTVANVSTGAVADAASLTFNPTVLQQGTTGSSNGGSIFHSGIQLSSQTEARAAMRTIDTMNERLLKGLGTNGSLQGRLEVAINTLSSTTANLQAAAARIKDADIAQEASNAITARIRGELTAKLIQQVNVQPSLALMLLKG
jgi:flagellin-like hook-associated protein FlgL